MATFALVHGGGGSAWDWHPVATELRERGHDPAAVDLPCEDPSAGWWDYADAVVEAIGDRSEVVVAGHSLGGFTAPLVCARMPVDLPVLVAAMIPSPGELFDDCGSARATRRAGTTTSSTTTCIPTLRPRRSGANETRSRGRCASRDRSRPGRARPRGTSSAATTGCSRRLGQRRHGGERSGIDADEMDGSHHITLSRPQELADRLAAYAAEAR